MEKPNFRIFRESLETRRAGRPVRVVEDAPRSKGTDTENEVATLIKALQGKDETLVDTAIVIYELLGIDHPSVELIKKVGDILEGNFPSIYDPDLRDAMFELLDEFDGWERASEADHAPVEPVHERLGEFRKGKEGRRHVVREDAEDGKFKYLKKSEDFELLRSALSDEDLEFMEEEIAEYEETPVDEYEEEHDTEHEGHPAVVQWWEGVISTEDVIEELGGELFDSLHKPVREGRKPSVIHDFLDDEEKMADFRKLSKEEFLKMYSYLSEEEYDATVKALAERRGGTHRKDVNAIFDDFLDLIEFDLVKVDGAGKRHWALRDRQGANLGGIESDRFATAREIVDRCYVYVKDYILDDEEWGEFDSLDDLLAKAPNHPLRSMVDVLVNHIDEVDLERCTSEIE